MGVRTKKYGSHPFKVKKGCDTVVEGKKEKDNGNKESS